MSNDGWLDEWKDADQWEKVDDYKKIVFGQRYRAVAKNMRPAYSEDCTWGSTDILPSTFVGYHWWIPKTDIKTDSPHEWTSLQDLQKSIYDLAMQEWNWGSNCREGTDTVLTDLDLPQLNFWDAWQEKQIDELLAKVKAYLDENPNGLNQIAINRYRKHFGFNPTQKINVEIEFDVTTDIVPVLENIKEIVDFTIQEPEVDESW